MSQDDQSSEAFGIEPFAPERDDELAMEAQHDELLQTDDEPILGNDEDSQTQMGAYGNIAEDLY